MDHGSNAAAAGMAIHPVSDPCSRRSHSVVSAGKKASSHAAILCQRRIFQEAAHCMFEDSYRLANPRILYMSQFSRVRYPWRASSPCCFFSNHDVGGIVRTEKCCEHDASTTRSLIRHARTSESRRLGLYVDDAVTLRVLEQISWRDYLGSRRLRIMGPLDDAQAFDHGPRKTVYQASIA